MTDTCVTCRAAFPVCLIEPLASFPIFLSLLLLLFFSSCSSPLLQDIERTIESDTQLRPGCSAAFSIDLPEHGEVLVVVCELRNP